MKKLKVASPKWAGYTGPLANVMFEDGVSVDFLPRAMRDRLSASMDFIEIDEDGNEMPAGISHRLVTETIMRAPVLTPLERQSDEEKIEEQIASVTEKIRTVYSRQDLEQIADEKGIKGLREVAEIWNVKHRSIPVLLEMILAEQEKYVAARKRRMAALGMTEEEIEQRLAEKPDEPAPAQTNETDKADETETVEQTDAQSEQTDVQKAAATGDLAAAITGQDTVA